jgi:hypothetical protein
MTGPPPAETGTLDPDAPKDRVARSRVRHLDILAIDWMRFVGFRFPFLAFDHLNRERGAPGYWPEPIYNG